MKRTLWVVLVVTGTAALVSSVPAAAQSSSARLSGAALAVPANVSVDLPAQEVGKNRSKGALWGGAIGLVAGGVLGGISVESDSGGGMDSGLVDAAATGQAVILGAVFGAGIGALLGATVFAPDRPGAASAFSVAPAVGFHGAGIVVRLR